MIEKTSPIARFLVIAAAFVIVVSGLKMAGALLVPFLLAVFIAMIVSPLLGWLKDRGIPGGLAILLIVILILLVGLLLTAVIGSSVDNFRQDIPALLRQADGDERGRSAVVEPARYCYRPAALAEQLRPQCRYVICRQHPGILWQCDDQCGDDPADSDIYSCGKYGLRRKTQIGQGI